ncbi:MAG TPA: MarR family transcriptional regulator [Mycobacteriales bacterium]|jgi:DNA-binding MarR family transcriptional regulator|nr:MarR family transcriptional regulator [Mycobacteriales bacterium]
MTVQAGDPLTHAETAARLRVVIARLARQLRQHSPGGLTPSQWSALAMVDTHGPLRIGDLAEREGVSAPTATRVVASLEELGFLSRTTDPADRRTSYIALTDVGRDKIESMRRSQSTELVQRLSAMPAQDVRRLVDLLPVLESLMTEDR